MLTQARVRELFDYREDGTLVWRVATANCMKVGATAGSLNASGYFNVQIKGRVYRLHRIIFLYHHGYFPETQVDHIDRNPLNNRIENLREVSQTCNSRNSGNPCTNTSGVKGVSWHNRISKWGVQIVVAERQRHLGYFPDFTEAVAHRLAHEQALNWEGCDSCSPAFQYMQDYIKGIVLPASPGQGREAPACPQPAL